MLRAFSRVSLGKRCYSSLNNGTIKQPRLPPATDTTKRAPHLTAGDLETYIRPLYRYEWGFVYAGSKDTAWLSRTYAFESRLEATKFATALLNVAKTENSKRYKFEKGYCNAYHTNYLQHHPEITVYGSESSVRVRTQTHSARRAQWHPADTLAERNVPGVTHADIRMAVLAEGLYTMTLRAAERTPVYNPRPNKAQPMTLEAYESPLGRNNVLELPHVPLPRQTKAPVRDSEWMKPLAAADWDYYLKPLYAHGWGLGGLMRLERRFLFKDWDAMMSFHTKLDQFIPHTRGIYVDLTLDSASRPCIHLTVCHKTLYEMVGLTPLDVDFAVSLELSYQEDHTASTFPGRIQPENMRPPSLEAWTTLHPNTQLQGNRTLRVASNDGQAKRAPVIVRTHIPKRAPSPTATPPPDPYARRAAAAARYGLTGSVSPTPEPQGLTGYEVNSTRAEGDRQRDTPRRDSNGEQVRGSTRPDGKSHSTAQMGAREGLEDSISSRLAGQARAKRLASLAASPAVNRVDSSLSGGTKEANGKTQEAMLQHAAEDTL